MRRSRLLVALLGVAALGALPARSADVPSTGDPQRIARGLTVYTSYADKGVTETIDAATGRLVSRVVHGGNGRVLGIGSGAGAGSAKSGAPANAADAPAAQSDRCSNWGVHEPNEPGSPRPWRMSESFTMNSSGAPSHMVGDWYNQIIEGKRVWEWSRNDCGSGDTIIWDMPGAYETGTPVNPDCGEPDDENVIGFANMGGWGDGLVLARTCVWWDAEFIYESDMIFNNHPDARWANGGYAGFWDLQSVASHEFGHTLGLGHVEPGASESTATAVMHAIVYRGQTRNRKLSRGDIEGASSLYPALHGFEIESYKIVNPAGSSQRLEPARNYNAIIEIVNRGYRPWRVGDSNGIGIATYPPGRCSRFAGGDWRSCAEPTLLDEAGSDEGGGPENDASIIAQGEIGLFKFTVPIEWGDEGVSSLEGFRVRGLPVADQGQMYLPIEVGTYKMSVVGQGGPGLLIQNMVVRGLPNSTSVTVRNDGTAPWMLGDGRMRLVTDPPGRCSRNRGGDWTDCRIASWIDDQVPYVLPGQTATFGFLITTPFHTDTASQYMSEFFDVEIIKDSPERQNAKTTFRFQVV